MLLPLVKPAPPSRRALSACIDLVLLAVSLVFVYQLLPVSPPPVDSMAFYTEQDFRNYLSIVVLTFLNATVGFVLVAIPGLSGTPGQLALGLKLVNFEGKTPSLRQVAGRWMRAMAPIALLAIPGPLVALIVGVVVASLLHTAFTSTDLLLVRAGVSGVVSLGLHGLSFVALGLAIAYMIRSLWNFMTVRKGDVLTTTDQSTFTTVVRRDG